MGKHLIRYADNFYDNIDYLRKLALGAEFRPCRTYQAGFFGTATSLAFMPCDIERRIKAKFGFKWVHMLPAGFGTGIGNACFYHCLGEDNSISAEQFCVHIDQSRGDYFAVVVYMTPEQLVKSCGTGIYRHKDSKKWYLNEGEDFIHASDEENIDKWDRIGFADYKYNRAVLYPGHWFHSAENNFGTCLEDARLYQALFFQAGPNIFDGVERQQDIALAEGSATIFPKQIMDSNLTRTRKRV